MIAKVISGGQTGVDIASLRAAKARGVSTGGTMPKGCRTLIGSRPDWALDFGLIEHKSSAYPPRTFQNVRDADLTIRIAADLSTAGEVCTQKAIDAYKRPQFDVQIRRSGNGYVVDKELIFSAADKIREVSASLGRPIVVNFAGNSERTAPGIEAFAEGVVKAIIVASTGAP